MKISLLQKIVYLQELFESIEFINIQSKLYDNKIEIGINNKYYSYKELKEMIYKQLSDDISIVTFIYL